MKPYSTEDLVIRAALVVIDKILADACQEEKCNFCPLRKTDDCVKSENYEGEDSRHALRNAILKELKELKEFHNAKT